MFRNPLFKHRYQVDLEAPYTTSPPPAPLPHIEYNVFNQERQESLILIQTCILLKKKWLSEIFIFFKSSDLI